MYRVGLLCITGILSNQFYANDIVLAPVCIQSVFDEEGHTFDEALNHNAFTLQERLQNDISFDIREGEKNTQSLSYRGIDPRSTTFYEDGIPLFKTISGDTATHSFVTKGSINHSSNEASLFGVSSMGTDVEINVPVPKNEFESTLIGMIGTNDTRFNASFGSRFESSYLTLETSKYQRYGYALSDDFTTTPAQPTYERRYSNWNQHDLAIKTGIYPDNHTHLALKLSSSRSHFDVPINTHTDITGNAGDDFWSADRVPWDAYTQVPKKDLDSVYAYGDFKYGAIETSIRAYYDQYKDIYAFYTDNSYEQYVDDKLDTYQDSRLGTNVKTMFKSSSHTDSIAIILEENTHRWYNNADEGSKYTTHFFEASYIGRYILDDQMILEGAVSYRSLTPKQYYDTRLIFNDYDIKESLDWQLKLSKISKNSSIYGSIGHKSRFPSMFEMFPLLPYDTVNSGLKPEQSINIESGIESKLFAETFFSFDAYHYAIKDRIVKPQNIAINRDKSLHYGIETRFKSDYFTGQHIELSYRYANAKDNDGRAVELVPNHRVSVSETVDIASDTTASVEYMYSGERFSDYLNHQYVLKAYQTVDIYFSFIKKEGFNFRMGVKNLLDENYEWRYGYPAYGRNAFISLEWKI